MRASRPSDRRSGPPGLLPWQFGVLGLAAGILALRFPIPACICLILVFLFSRCAGLGVRGRLGVALCFLAGWALAVRVLPGTPDLPPWTRARAGAEVRGLVARTEARPDRVLRVFLEDASYELENGERGALPGLVLWNWSRPASRPLPGDRVRVRLRLRPVRGFANQGGWDTAFHWRRQGVFLRGWSRGGRGSPELLSRSAPGPVRLREAVRVAVAGDDPHDQGRALLAALVLGDRLHLAPELCEALRAASLGHSLALSGLHLGFAAALGFGLAWLAGRARPSLYLRLPRLKLGVLLAAPCAGLYLWLGGAGPSLVRAGVMLASWGLFLWLDRERPLLDGLFLAVLLILAASPLSLYDMRLQFSVLAVAGIAVLGPVFWPFLPWPRRGQGPVMRLAARLCAAVLGTLGVSLCAVLALWPLTAWYFGQSAASLWLNVLWLPLLGLFAVPVGLVGALLSVVPGLGGPGQALLSADAAALSLGADGVLALHRAGLLPVFTLPRPLGPQILGLYALAAAAAVFLRARCRAALIAGGLALGLLVWPLAARILDGDALRLTLLDVGQGQAVLIEVPGGGRTLVDGGGPWSPTFDVGRAVVLPALARGRWPSLDRVVLSHPDGDHYLGLIQPLSHGRVGLFAHNGRWPDGPGGRALRAAVEESGAAVEVWSAGQRHELAPGIVLEVLHPDPGGRGLADNDASLVLHLTWRGRGLALICGDVEARGIEALLARAPALDAQVLVLPHHGSRDALSPALYRACAPRLALASAGFMNHLGCPAPEVLAALAGRGVPVLDTPACGQIGLAWTAPDSSPRIETVLGPDD
ncbi:ComEC/Rec2 family competence protein [Desulfocurvus sp. DL9XJH121]